MKKYFALILLCMSCNLYAQTPVKFSIQPTGNFIAENGNDYLVVEFEGKTADELYSMVKDNVLSLYKDPKSVMSENNGSAITIHGFADNVAMKKFLMLPTFYGAYYNLVFKFKDGRIRVDAPVIDNDLKITGGGTTASSRFLTLQSHVSSCYDQKGELIKKKAENIAILEDAVNHPINVLLGFTKHENDTKEDDDNW